MWKFYSVSRRKMLKIFSNFCHFLIHDKLPNNFGKIMVNHDWKFWHHQCLAKSKSANYNTIKLGTFLIWGQNHRSFIKILVRFCLFHLNRSQPTQSICIKRWWPLLSWLTGLISLSFDEKSSVFITFSMFRLVKKNCFISTPKAKRKTVLTF